MHETARLLCDLVALPSVNPMGRTIAAELAFEHRVTNYLEAHCRSLGLAVQRQTVAPLRDNIVATYHSPASGRTILLEVHQDTVPADNMTIAPFAATIEGGRLHGRGSCDVKGGMAAMLHALGRLAREKPPRSASVHLACTVDEEHTFLGVQALMRMPVRADMAVVAEPTKLQIVDAHKGVVRWHLETSGRSCHSSTPEQGINAIYRMGRLLPEIERYAGWLRQSHLDPRLGPPTLSVGRIQGGASANIVPERCRIEIDRRLVTGEDPRAAPGQLADFLLESPAKDVPFAVSEPWLYAPALSGLGSEEVRQRLGDAIRHVVGKCACVSVPFGTDASTIAEGGIPAVVFGPGDIARAHTCDEWVPLEEVEAASDIFYRLICQD